ncbi:acyl-CoA reductase [Chryseobacterium koreense]|uniref:acyl-CoA reductase n=1 Tax=Chryseobacterium koreense TaxID=232216 RepID=UPI0026EADA8A|nr:acyl-CoA reductase [Chryseobacterium koreense]
MNIQQLVPVKRIVPYTTIQNNANFPVAVFDDLVVAYLSALGREILRDDTVNRVPAAAALAHWLRKANIQKIKEENQYIFNNRNISLDPYGTVFHICPSNVDTMFIYSLAIALLAGNKNILRVSQKMDSYLMDRLFQLMNSLLQSEEFNVLADYIIVLQYGYEEEINTFFSMKADARIIWGGDRTIDIFKKIKSKPRVRDFYFSDRLSFSIINLNEFFLQTQDNQLNILRRFYNDSYTFDQKGCSSPQRIFFIGDDGQIQKFYQKLSGYAVSNYQADMMSVSSLKLNYQIQDILSGAAQYIINDNNYLTFVQSDTENEEICGGGYFYIKKIKNIEEIAGMITKRVQTLTYFGLSDSQILQLQKQSYGRGVDRIVPIGNALDFHYIWDGYNLFTDLIHKKFKTF